MRQMTFVDPIFGRKARVLFDDFAKVVAAKGEDYWNSPQNSSQAVLETYKDPKRTKVDKCLVFSMKDGLGFHINYQDWKGGGLIDNWYPVSSTDFSSTAWLHSAGEKMQLAAALFIPVQDALRVFRYFFGDGGRTPDVQWMHSNDIPWYNFEDYRSL